MQMCSTGHPGTKEQPTCCIRCSPINKVNLAGLPLTRRFKKAAMFEGSHLTSTPMRYYFYVYIKEWVQDTIIRCLGVQVIEKVGNPCSRSLERACCTA